MLLNILQRTGQHLTTKNDLAQNVSGATVEKSYSNQKGSYVVKMLTAINLTQPWYNQH